MNISKSNTCITVIYEHFFFSGIVKFHETNMSELETDYGEHSDTLSMRSVNFGSCSLLDQYVGHVRESMGIESHAQK